MKNTKRILALLMAISMMLMLVGHAEGQAVVAPSPSPMAAVVDQTLAQEEAETGTVAPVAPDASALPDASISTVELSLEPAEVSLEYSQSATLTTNVPETAGTVAWASSDTKVATLSATSGASVQVVGVNEGTATITCTLGEQSQTCVVTVHAPETLQITGVDYPSTLKASSRGWKLRQGTLASVDDLKTLTSSITNANGESIGEPYTYTFSGSVKRYEIKGIDNYVPFSRASTEGQYTWTLSATDAAGRSVSVALPIQIVVDGETAITNNQGVFAPILITPDDATNVGTATMQAGETKQMTAKRSEADTTTSDLVWVSYDPTVATVSTDGLITAVAAGTTTITCRMLDNSCISAGYNIVVNDGSTPAVTGNAATAPTTNPAANVAVSDTQIGGRNYAINSAFTNGLEDWNKRGPVQIYEIVNSDGANWLHIKGDAAPSISDNSNVQGTSQGAFQKYNLHAIPGKPYTLSAKVRGAGADQHCYLNLRWGRDDNTHIANAFYGFTLSENAQIISITITAPAEADTITINVTTNCQSEKGTIGNNETNEFYITDIKLELVNTPTAWTPAPEDMNVPIN